jgi:crossover junction endodeoxyribonuclease RuvC
MIVGVGIGTRGAVALLSPRGELLEIVDMPVRRDGPKERPAVNAALLAETLYRWHPLQAYVELVDARPEEGAVGAFAFGRARGVVEGVLAACGVAVTHIAPAVWKEATIQRWPAGKGATRSEAICRWSDHFGLFTRVRDDARAEAALIGVVGILRARGLL